VRVQSSSNERTNRRMKIRFLSSSSTTTTILRLALLLLSSSGVAADTNGATATLVDSVRRALSETSSSSVSEGGGGGQFPLHDAFVASGTTFYAQHSKTLTLEDVEGYLKCSGLQEDLEEDVDVTTQFRTGIESILDLAQVRLIVPFA